MTEWKWAPKTPSLTRAEFDDGAPCPGCGLPYVDGRPLALGTMNWTDEDRARDVAERVRFAAEHGDCPGPGSWMVAGSSTRHCYDCCPPLPLDGPTVANLRALLGYRR